MKNRDFWMPFCRIRARRAAPLYSVNPKQAASPYMILSFDTTQKKRRLGERHTSLRQNPCRPQIVSREANPDYWKLIDEFRQLNGIGGVVNTSLDFMEIPEAHADRRCYSARGPNCGTWY